MSKYMIKDLESNIIYTVSCPNCESDDNLTLENYEEDYINGGFDSEYFCEECGSTFYESELDLDTLEISKDVDIDMEEIEILGDDELKSLFRKL